MGKALLARILAGHLSPTAGHCQRSDSAHRVRQYGSGGF
nr:hypothetical protein [Halomonas socia]